MNSINQIFHIKTHKKPSMELFCDGPTCNETCYIACMQKYQTINLVVLNNEQENCYKLFQVSLLQNHSRHMIPIVNKSECLINVFLNYNNATIITLACLDTGAQCNVLSWNRFKELFPGHGIPKINNKIELKAADSNQLTCLGEVNIQCQIQENIKMLKFYIIKQGSVLLLGTPAITEFGLIINLKKQECFIQNVSYNQNNTSLNRGFDDCPTQTMYIVQLTVKNKYHLNIFKNTVLELELVSEKNIDNILYKKVLVYDCNCLIEFKILCEACNNSTPMISSYIKPNNSVLINFAPMILQDLQPYEYFFQGIINPSESLINTGKTVDHVQINYINDPATAEPPAFTWNGTNLGFEEGGLQQNQTFFPSNSEDKFQDFDNYYKESICEYCKGKNLQYFCDFEDEKCINYRIFRNRVLDNDIFDAKCTISVLENCPQHFQHLNIILPYFENSIILKKWISINFPFWTEYLQNDSKEKCRLKIMNYKSIFHFAIVGTISTYLEIIEILEEIYQICILENLKNLYFIDFDNLSLSQSSIKRIFKNITCTIYILPSLTKNNVQINKIGFDHGNVAHNIEEKSIIDDLNILTNDERWILKLKNLARDLDIEAGPLRSLWSRGTHDLGLLTSGKPLYKVIEFDFPIRSDAELIPVPNKTSYINPQLIPAATGMLQALLDIKVISRSYSKFNAVTHWIPKPKPELTLKQFIAQGNDPKNFVAGIENRLAPQTLRMVQHFSQLNKICYSNPINQLGTMAQIKQICQNVKYISVIDITGSFHSIQISKSAKEYTGFDSGLSGWNRMVFNRLPMGFIASKNIQDNALLHVLSNIDGLQIYSDNILCLSSTEEDHFQTLSKTLHKLRDHGLKCKASKSSLFCSKKIKLYGVIVDLETGKLSPDADKIKALRNRPVPRTKKQLKQFLGSLNFFSQLMPLAPECVSILNRATRGKLFKFGEEEKKAYEDLQYLLKDSNLLFVYRPNDELRYHIVVDSSLYHSAWITYQICDKGHPRIISYNIKTWESSYQNAIVALRELYGIIAALQNVQHEIEHSKRGAILFTDSLPIVLCSVASKFNAKIARYKIFLSSLSWVEINFSPGISHVLALSDYFSRKCDDKPAYSQKLPNTCDTDLCYQLEKKLNKSLQYKASDSIYLIDSLVAENKDTINDIQENSYQLESSNKISYISIKSKTKKYSCNADIQKVASIHSKMDSSLEACNKMMSEDSLNIGDIDSNNPAVGENVSVFDGSGDVHNCHAITRAQVKQAENAKVGKTNDDIQLPTFNEKCSKSNLSYDINNPDVKNYLNTQYGEIHDILELVGPHSRKIDLNQMEQKEVQQNRSSNSKFESFYSNFLGIAKYLNKTQLSDAQEFDVYWKEIISKCRDQETYLMNGKKYFLHDNLLFCSEEYKGLTIYKIVIPCIISHDLVMQAHRHYGCIRNKKLFNQISTVFEIRNLFELCTRVVNECYSCSLSGKKPCGKYRQDLPKNPTMLLKKLICWSIDEVQLCSKITGQKHAGFNKLISATCMFSHFMVCTPVYGILDEKQVLNFIQEKIIAIFGYPRILVTDNQSCMHSNQVIKVCNYLHIHKSTTSAYTSKSNLQELTNRLILDSIRNLSASTYLEPQNIHILLSPIIHLVNSLVFSKEKILSPYFIVFAQRPNIDILTFYDGSPDIFKSKEDYIKQVVLLNSALTKIRLAHIESRKYQQNSTKVQNYYDKIQAGSIVSINNPELIIKKQDYKLRPKFKNRFIVIKRTKSAVFLKPCDEIYLQDFLKQKQIDDKSKAEVYYKADLSSVKLISNLMILNSNNKAKFYRNFLQKHEIPKPIYFFENENGAQLRHIDELKKDISKNVIDELKEAENLINYVQRPLKSKSILKISYHQQQINDISSLFDSLTKVKSKFQIQSVKISNSVRFQENVTCYNLICPDIVYYALKPRQIPLKDKFCPAIRKLNKYFCVCNKCKLMLSTCKAKPCNKCFGNFGKQDTVVDEPIFNLVS